MKKNVSNEIEFERSESGKITLIFVKKQLKTFSKTTLINKTIVYKKKKASLTHKKFTYKIEEVNIKKHLGIDPEVFYEVIKLAKEKFNDYKKRDHISVEQLLYVTLYRIR
jgi:hypothetical protein